jgi:hypothetical protein
MTRKNQMLLNITMIIVSWLAIPLLGKRTIIRFLPATVISMVICSLDLKIGKRRKWWVFHNNPRSSVKNEIPFLIGPMLVMGLGTLKYAFGDFKKFIFLNAIGGAFFTGPLTKFFTKLNLYKLVKINHFQFFLYFFYKAFILYGFQLLYDQILNRVRSKELL